MKKIFTILLVSITAFMLSSCVIFLKDKEFDITCENDTLRKVTDWCVVQDGNYTYANSDYNCEIRSGRSDTIHDLPKDYYTVCFSFKNINTLHPRDYETSYEVYLDEDVVYYISERKFYGRTANDSSENEEPVLVLVDSNGKEYLPIENNK